MKLKVKLAMHRVFIFMGIKEKEARLCLNIFWQIYINFYELFTVPTQ